ncbi:hypothetical protein E3V39_10880 [Gammaproteobacteria bacterium LSUCC0112]|nr:hypothetical protein E3V39_10880 [Gammaproteobacteria bacterium LSUCC0112]
MNNKHKTKSNKFNSTGMQWQGINLVLCLVLASGALAISLLAPDQLLAGGVVTWSVVASLLSGVVLAIRSPS